MFGKASSSHITNCKIKGCLEAPYLLTARVFSIYVPDFPLLEPIRLQDLASLEKNIIRYLLDGLFIVDLSLRSITTNKRSLDNF